MHRLDDIFKISHSVLSGEPPQELPDGESPIFNAAWLVFMCTAPEKPSIYSNLWNSGAGMMMGKTVDPVMSAESVQLYSRFISHSYIACGLNCAEKLRSTPDANVEQLLSETIAPKLMFITALALLVNTRRIPYSPDGKLPNNLRAALSEFYSLAQFALTELKANVSPAFHEGVNLTLHDIKYTTAKHDLPRLLGADERHTVLAALSGVHIMPKRPGIAMGQQNKDADIIEISRLLRRNTRQNKQ